VAHRQCGASVLTEEEFFYRRAVRSPSRNQRPQLAVNLSRRCGGADLRAW
jgi:hypothetical protein